jgi:hypothetical protein
VPSWAQTQGEGLRFPALGYRTGLTRQIAGQAKREHDLVMAAPSVEDSQLEYQLPKGWKIAQAPADKSIDTPLARSPCASSTRATGPGHHPHRVPQVPLHPAEYRALRDFLSQVDGSLDQVFEIRPER